MESKTPSAPNGSACELCHRRKVRCDMHAGRVPCSHCESVNQPCVPHRRKRKHDPGIDPSAPKRLTVRSMVGSPVSPRARTASILRSELTHLRGESLPSDDETSPGSYLGRAEYVSGTAAIDEDDAKRYSSGRTTSLADEDKRYLLDLRAFDLPVRSLHDSLIASFFEYCYPWMPIVEPSELRTTDTFRPSLLLLQSVYVAASRVSPAPDARASGDAFYRKAKALYHLGYEKNPMNIVRSICLILWFNNSGPEHVSTDASSFWLSMGVALAHQLGLHREPNPKQQDAKLRRRLWWTLFIRDCQIATSHGRPRTINPEDCDVRPLTLKDFPEQNDNARLFLAYLSICSILKDLTQALVQGTLGSAKKVSIETRLSSWIQDLPDSIRICDRQNGTLLPYNFKSRQLNVMFFTALMLLYRPAAPGVVPSVAAVLASSFSTGIFEDFLARGEIGFLAPVFNFHLMTAAFAQLACYRYPAFWTRAEGELETINKCLVEMAKRYPTAVGAQRVIKAVFRAVGAQKRHEGPTHPTREPEQLEYFEQLGPDLCSKWSLIMPSHGAETPRALSSLRQLALSEPVLAGHGPLDNVSSFTANADANFALVNHPESHEVPSLSESLLADIGEHDSYFASNGAFTAVGNWMLGDWTADLDWMTGGFGV